MYDFNLLKKNEFSSPFDVADVVVCVVVVCGIVVSSSSDSVTCS